MKYICHLIVMCSIYSITPWAGAADLESLTNDCDGCHGDSGVSQWSDMPSIAGIDEFAHSEALFIYRDNARPCAKSEYRLGDTTRPPSDMCSLTMDLTDKDIEALAAHYAALPFVPAAQAFDADLAADGAVIHESECGLCHTDGGSNPADEASILAGQWIGYLERSFLEYRSGERDAPPWMKQKMDALNDDDVQALLNYYASQQ